MRKIKRNGSVLLLVCLTVALSIGGPEALSVYQDRKILGEIQTTAMEEGEGYRYKIGRDEKLYILSQCLSSRLAPESDQSAMTRNISENVGYQEGSYALVVNHKEPSEKEMTEDEIFEVCNRELTDWKELGILPDSVKRIEGQDYDSVFYSAIDVLEPGRNLAVWKISLAGSQNHNATKNRMMDLYIDADDGKIYEFYARTELTWEDIDPDAMIKKWSSYLGLENPDSYVDENSFLETTPYLKNMYFPGTGRKRRL